MQTLQIDARGEQCPIPVVKTIKALDGLREPAQLEVHVDNETAVQNVTRLEAARPQRAAGGGPFRPVSGGRSGSGDPGGGVRGLRTGPAGQYGGCRDL